MTEVTYATVRCCRDWPIIFRRDGLFVGWRRCGECMEMPVLVDVEDADAS